MTRTKNLWREISMLLGISPEVSYEERMLNIIGSVLLLLSTSNVMFFESLGLPFPMRYAMILNVPLSMLVLYFNRRLKRFGLALIALFFIQINLGISEWVFLGGMQGTFPFLFIVSQVMNFSVVKHQWQWPYLFASLLMVVIIGVVRSMEVVPVVVPDHVDEIRFGQFVTVFIVTSACLVSLRKAEHAKRQQLADNYVFQQHLLQALEQDSFLVSLMKKRGQTVVSYISDSIHYHFPNQTVEQIKQMVLGFSAVKLLDGQVVAQQEEEVVLGTKKRYFKIIHQQIQGTLNLIVQDITPLRKQEEGLRVALAKELELNKMKSEFISMVSHQFRTPLTTIHSATELLKLYASAGSRRDFMRMGSAKISQVQESVVGLTAIMERLLDFGKIEAGEMRLQINELDMVELVTKVIDQQKKIYPERSLLFTCIGQPKLVPVDRYLFKHIFGNLINNAMKYSDEDSTVEVFLFFHEESYTIYVCDRGIGISQEEIGHLFTPFFRAKNAENHKGTGIGLAFVKHFVEMNQGEIFVSSRLGVGTSFALVMPYRLREELDADEGAAHEDESQVIGQGEVV
ncbi:HAMP domain-containing sensor histidine kinase [Persicobacter psychrovividus]|uniref:histidine kinase n=1 Tax=Persicobacter psychrovividus TaxID=387638 RepID=A0ABM7VJ52_9BACT|nr:hypothetical protein PEPS_33030 [Persicobacter psychrovividus]